MTFAEESLYKYKIEILNILEKPQYPRNPLCAYKLSMSNLTCSAYYEDIPPIPYNAICLVFSITNVLTVPLPTH